MKKQLLCMMLVASMLIPSMPVMAEENPTNQTVVETTEFIEAEVPVEVPEATETEVPAEAPEATETEVPVEVPEATETEMPTEAPEATEIEVSVEMPEIAEDEVAQETPEVIVDEVDEETPEAIETEVDEEVSEQEEIIEITETVTDAEVPELEEIEVDAEVLAATEIEADAENSEELEALPTSAPMIEAQTEEWYVVPSYQDEYSENDIRELAQQQNVDEILTAGENITVSSDAEAAQKIREAMKARNSVINLTFTHHSALSAYDLVMLAVKDDETGPVDEGDYLLGNLMGFGGTAGSTGCSINFTYASTASQEAGVNTAINQAVASLNLSSMSDYEKIKAIHDYIVNHVTYVNDGTIECHSTYAAIVKGKAVCQGYATLFYRMCRMAGIPVRYITGTASGGHAWNIVKLGDVWYNIDVTWDDPDDGTIDNTYFLKADIDFSDHYRDEQYRTESFYAAYPMAATSYGEAAITKLNLKNSINKSLATVDGDIISTQSNGKPKIIVFFGYNCWNSKNTLLGFDSSTWAASGKVDVCAVDVRKVDAATITAFRDEYCPNGKVKVGYCTNSAASNAMWDYLEMSGEGAGSVTLPVVVMLDANNKLQFVTTGPLSEEKVNKVYLPLLLEGWVPTEDAVTNPITSIIIRTWPKLEYIDTYYYDELKNGSTVSLKVGQQLYLKGIGVPKDKYNIIGIANTDTTFNIDNGAVAVYDASTGVLNAVKEGSATLTFASVTNPEVTATLNITVVGTIPTPKPTATPKPTTKPTISGWPFGDVAQSGWKYNGVKYVYESGIMNGVGDGTRFDPDAPLTRGMFATVLWRMAGEPAVVYEAKFADVPAGKWYSNAVVWAYKQGIVSGLDGGTRFGTNENITREQMAKMLMGYANLRGHGTNIRADLSSFEDHSAVSKWATDYMKWAVGCGMINGSTKNGKYYLNPKGQATRAECATMLSRFVPVYG